MKSREAQGHIFELAFNVGILTAIHQSGMKYDRMDLFTEDLKRLNHRTVVDKLVDMKRREGFIDAESLGIWEGWGKLLLMRGHLGGLSFWNELMDSLGGLRSIKNWELLYMQCCLSNETSMRTLKQDDRDRYCKLLSQLGITEDEVMPYINQYANTGEFLKADTLMLLCNDTGQGKEYRIVCVDLSAFTVERSQDSDSPSENEGICTDLWNLSSATSVLEHLKSELRHFKSKSVYHNLKIDTEDGKNKQLLGEYIKEYLTAFSYYDKEFVKLVQAASYAASFVNFLESEVIISSKDWSDSRVQVTAVGYTTRGISTLNVEKEDFHILNLCADAYKLMKGQERSDRENSINTYERKLVKMLDLIKSTAIESLLRSPKTGPAVSAQEPKNDDSRQKIEEFVMKLGETNIKTSKTVYFSETIADFHNPSDPYISSELKLPDREITLRDANTIAIQQELSGSCRYLFLTGNPGIGKTTAVVNFLCARAKHGEGFLFFYISPRLCVNEDTIKKFQDSSGRLFFDDMYCVYTSKNVIDSKGGEPTVKYYSNEINRDFSMSGVHFLGEGDAETRPRKQRYSISRDSDRDLGYYNQQGTGVIKSLCDAGHALLDDGINKIAITCSTQSLRKLDRGGNSLKHFRNLFRSVTNQTGEVIPEEMQKLSARITHIIVMIDEVTGDSNGVEWLHSMKQWLASTLKLFDDNYEFNTKLIVADASLADVDVVKRHLASTEAEPDKIYCYPVVGERPPLEIKFDSFFRSAGQSVNNSAIVNVNSYPAKSIELTYKVFFEVSKINEDGSIKDNPDLRNKSLLTEIAAHLERSNSGQLLVYIQDKQRLKQLISLAKQKIPSFQRNNNIYLELHAQVYNSSERKELLARKDQDVRVVFMTSSASRGISFPKAKHIIVELPRFQIENNLMEIVQVIYRGRGQFGEGENNDRATKKITAYIVEKVFSNPEKSKAGQIVSAANLIGSLLILRTAIMTRITGSGFLGKRKMAMIPIGSKAMYSGGETFSTRIKFFLRQLKSYLRTHSDRYVKRVLEGMPNFLGSAKYLAQKSPESSNSPKHQKQGKEKISLLFLLEKGMDFFFEQCSCMADLFDIELDSSVYIDGSLLIMPMNNRTVKVSYKMDPYSQIGKNATQEFRNALKNISQDNYPDNIKNEAFLAIDFIENLQQNAGVTQHLSDSTNFSDQYLAVPLHFLLADRTLKQAFVESQNKEALKGAAGDSNSALSHNFRVLLESYVKALYPASDFLPIGDGYADFPWVIFKSYDLVQMRRSLFSANYCLNSRSLNLLNLILARH